MTKPRYMQIVETLQKQRTRLDAPAKLPDEHAMARQFGVARHTVRQALGLLEQQGAVTRLPRRGTYLQSQRPVIDGLKNRAIGFVPPAWAESISHWYTSRVFDGASRWANEAGCHLHVLPMNAPTFNHSQWTQCVDSLNLAGLLWVHPKSTQLPLMERLSSQIPIAVVGRTTPSQQACHVMPDYEQAVQLIDRHLTQLGHHNYALLLYDVFDAFSRRLIQCFEKTYERRRVTFDLRNNIVDLRPYKNDRKADILLDGYEWEREHVQAYVVLDSDLLFHLVRNERFRKLVGTERSVIVFDFGQHPLTASWPGRDLSYVNCNWPDVGWQAAAMLAQRITGNPTPDIRTIPVKLETGQTCVAFDPTRVPKKRWRDLWTLYNWPPPKKQNPSRQKAASLST